jgi:RNA polymerase sigma-70 factor (ECF subfamily)
MGSRSERPVRASRDSWLTREAVTRAKAGDSEGIHSLYVRFAPDVQRYVADFVHDPDEAEDITQDVFAKLLTAIDGYERDVPFVAWIMRVARDAALDHLRAKRALSAEEVGVADTGRAKTSRDRGSA